MLSVVGFHAFPEWVSGGFIGVDVFFVISGFLISTIIFENLVRQSFSFGEFYLRRIRRIFPALILVLFTSGLIGWFVLLGNEYKQLGKHMAAGAGFVSNFVLWAEAGYFDIDAATKPLLHLWSLGIEEQFYIIWPLFIFLLFRFKSNVLLIVALVALISLSLNLNEIGKDAVATFYSPLTRFWELLCGSLLAWLSLSRNGAAPTGVDRNDARPADGSGRGAPIEASGPIVSNISALGGAAILAFGFTWINKDVPFPGIWAVLPVLGTVMILSAGQAAWFNRALLSHRLAVWFGLISFPLYLWHWPLLSFARIVAGETPGYSVRIGLVFLSVLLAWLTYRFIETPVRQGHGGRATMIVLIGVMTALGCAGYLTYREDGFRSRQVVLLNPILEAGAKGEDQDNTVRGCGIDDEKTMNLFSVCLKDKRGPARYALFGDSKAEVLWPGLVRTSTDEGRWLFVGGVGATATPLPLLSPDPRFAHFQKQTAAAVDALARNKDLETVALVAGMRAIFALGDGIVGGNMATYNYRYLDRLNHYDNYGIVRDGFDRTISVLVAAGKKVLLVADNPPLPNPQDCVARKTSLGIINAFLGGRNEGCYVQLDLFLEQTAGYRSMLVALRDKYPAAVEIIDPTPLLCDLATGICGPTLNGRLLYSYTDHISDYAAGLVGHEINDRLNH